MKVLSIDIGIHHLGVSLTTINDMYRIQSIDFFELINITNFGCDRDSCELYHESTFCDWIDHVLQKHKDIFYQADKVLIERQPPQGLVAVEQLLFKEFRSKAVLVSPNSVHKFFKIGCYDYEQRKVHSEDIARKCIKSHSDSIELFEVFARKHDIADSIIIMMYWCKKHYNEIVKKQCQQEKEDRYQELTIIKKDESIGLDTFFDQFKYIPKL